MMRRILVSTVVILLVVSAICTQAQESPSPSPEVSDSPSPSPDVTDSPSPSPEVADSPSPSPDVTDSPSPSPAVDDSPSPSPAVADSPSPSPTVADSPSPSPTVADSPSPSPTVADSPSPSPTVADSPSPFPTVADSPSPSPTVADSPSPSPTVADSPSPSPTVTGSPSPSPVATGSPSPSPAAADSPSPSPAVTGSNSPIGGAGTEATPSPGTEVYYGCFPHTNGTTCLNRTEDIACKATAGRIELKFLASGGLQDCTVYRTDLLVCEQSNATTNVNGTAVFPNGTLGLYTVNPSTSCKARTTGQALRWTPSLALAPPTTTAVITPLATLALAASRDPAVLEKLNLTTQQAVGSRSVLAFVFKMYGYDEASIGMDLLTFKNASIARPMFAAFYGTNIQLSGLFSIMSAALTPILPKPAVPPTRRLLADSTSPAQAISEALTLNIYKMLTVTPATSLIDTTDISSLLAAAYADASAKVSGVAPVDAAKQTNFFKAVAKVVDNVDTRLRGMIVAAKAYDTGKDDISYTMPLATIMAIHSSVAEGVASTAVSQLATDLAAGTPLNLAARLTQLTEDFSAAALTLKFSSTGLTQSKVFSSLSTSSVTPSSLVNPASASTTVTVPSKPGLLGLLGLLGLIGLIGVIPAALSIPAGVLLIGSLLLAPTGTSVTGNSVGTLITNCINNVPVKDLAMLKTLNKDLPDTILQQIAIASVCLPGGTLYNSTNSTGVSNDTSFQVKDLPPGTVLVGNTNSSTTTVILPPGIGVNSSSLPNTTVVYVGTTTPADVNTGGATLPGDSWSVAPAPVDTCGKALPSIAPLSVIDAAPAGANSTKLQSALRGIGSLSNCAGDYYSYTALSDGDQAALKQDAYHFNRDYYGIMYKDFVTGGPDVGTVVTRGTFGVENVTGPGHLVASGAWKGSSENHKGEVNCLDSWTGLSVKIPVAGLTPFPSDAKSQESWAEHVVATPVTMATLGQGLANATVAELQAKYDAAYTDMGAKVAGMFTQCMINSDPLRMLNSTNASHVTSAVTVLAANAQALGAMTVVRALAECKGTLVSNELYAQWAAALLKAAVLEDVAKLTDVLKASSTCLPVDCASGAARSFVAIAAKAVSLKAFYKTSSVIPPSIQEDLLTITQIARVAQSDLYDSIKQCCSAAAGSSSASFDKFTATNLATVMSSASASINATAVLESGSFTAAAPAVAVPAMAGRLLNSAGVKNCVGKYEELPAKKVTLDLTTSSTGSFSITNPATAAYTFKSSYPGSTCVDSLTNVNVTFPFILRMPAATDAAITAISLLTVPAASDPDVLAQYASADNAGQAVPAYLWQHVYSMFGYGDYATIKQADFPSLGGTAFTKQNGKTSPLLVAVLGSNAQTMSTFVSTQKLMLGLLGSTYSEDEVAKAVVEAVYSKFKAVNPVNAAETLVSKTHLVSMYMTTYKALKGSSSGATGRHLLQAALTDDELGNVFGAVANTVSATNTQVQTAVAAATQAAADPTSNVDAADLMVTVSQMAAVQQQSLAADVGSLATNFAANPSTTAITTLENDYSGTALNTKLAAVTIDKATVESAMTAALPTPAAPADATNTTTAPTRMEAIKSLAWVAGPVVGGVVLLALVWYWIAKRRAAQAIGMKPQAGAEARGSAEGRDGSTPREAWGANGAPRAQAALHQE